ncbi:MAG: DedA family protein [Helicobacter sp.]|nr:DedA family protein [Helicobacter sp.]
MSAHLPRRELLHDFILAIIELVGDLGYLGLFLMMLLESSFVPFPSEIAMIPAGYLAYAGELNFFGAVCSGIAGSLAGALLNYALAYSLGREILLRYGRFVGVSEQKLQSMEIFFARYGDISTFAGRFIPVVRQYISLPAGAARMPLAKFAFFTAFGAGIWILALTLLGYYLGAILSNDFSLEQLIAIFIGDDTTSAQALQIRSYMRPLIVLCFVLVLSRVALYAFYKRQTRRTNA